MEIEDQRLALAPENGWAFGVGNMPSLEESTEFKGYLYRPKQREIIWAPERYPSYWGGFGSSKSATLWFIFLRNCLMFPGTRGLIMRLTFESLEKTFIPSGIKIMDYLGWKAGVHYRWASTKHIIHITCANGVESEIIYLPATHEGQSIEQIIENLKSFEVDFAGLDEPVQVPFRVWDTLKYRVGRYGKIPNSRFHQLYTVGNPPNENHYLYKYYENHTDKDDNPIPNPEDYFLVRAPAYENRANIDPKIITELENSTDENYKRVYLYGESGYIAPEGIPVYPNFSYDLFVARNGVEYNPSFPLILGMDLGPTDKYKACVFLTYDFRQVVYVLAELLYEKPGIANFGHAVNLMKNTYFPNAHVQACYADPQAINVRSQTDFKTAADILRLECGLLLREGESAYNVRQNAVVELMSIVDGVPHLRIDGKRAPLLVQGFQGSYRHKELDTDDGRVSTGPIKDRTSHVHNALEYACSRLMFVSKKAQARKIRNIKDRNPKIYRNKKRSIGSGRYAEKQRP